VLTHKVEWKLERQLLQKARHMSTKVKEHQQNMVVIVAADGGCESPGGGTWGGEAERWSRV
jgi:hypothetical protein